MVTAADLAGDTAATAQAPRPLRTIRDTDALMQAAAAPGADGVRCRPRAHAHSIRALVNGVWSVRWPPPGRYQACAPDLLLDVNVVVFSSPWSRPCLRGSRRAPDPSAPWAPCLIGVSTGGQRHWPRRRSLWPRGMAGRGAFTTRDGGSAVHSAWPRGRRGRRRRWHSGGGLGAHLPFPPPPVLFLGGCGDLACTGGGAGCSSAPAATRRRCEGLTLCAHCANLFLHRYQQHGSGGAWPQAAAAAAAAIRAAHGTGHAPYHVHGGCSASQRICTCSRCYSVQSSYTIYFLRRSTKA